MNQQPRTVRPLGKMERSAWIFDQASPFNLGSAVDLHGTVTEADLRRVLRWCQARYPLLRSLLRLEKGQVCFACYEPKDAPPIPLETGAGEPDDRDRIGTEELRRPFDGMRELMIRVRLVRYAPDHCGLFVTFQHLIGDGLSAANLMVDIVEQLGKAAAGEVLPEAVPLPFPPMLEDGVAPQYRGWRGLRELVRCQAKVNGRMNELGDMPAPLRNDNSVPFAERRVRVETISFSKSETVALIERARQEKVTLYALLVGATLHAIHPLLAESPKKRPTSDRVVTMPIPTNLRPFLSIDGGMEFGFYASTVDVVCKLTGNDDILEMARMIRQETKAAMKKDSPRLHVMPTLAAIMDWRLFFSNERKGVDRAARFIASMAKYSSTSMTFLNFQKLARQAGELRVTEARGYVAPSMLGTAIFSAVLFADVLNVHLSYNEKQFSGDDAALLKSRLRETALAVAGSSAAIAT